MDNEKKITKNDASGATDSAKKGAKVRNPGLRALLAIKKISATLETDFVELLALEKDLHTLNQKVGPLLRHWQRPKPRNNGS